MENFPITVQPAEIVKITFIILLARQLALLQEKKDLTRFSNVIQPTAHAGIMFLFYYVISKDAGSGLVYLFVFVCMAFAGGFALRWIFLGLGGAVKPSAWLRRPQPRKPASYCGYEYTSSLCYGCKGTRFELS